MLLYKLTKWSARRSTIVGKIKDRLCDRTADQAIVWVIEEFAMQDACDGKPYKEKQQKIHMWLTDWLAE